MLPLKLDIISQSIDSLGTCLCRNLRADKCWHAYFDWQMCQSGDITQVLHRVSHTCGDCYSTLWKSARHDCLVTWTEFKCSCEQKCICRCSHYCKQTGAACALHEGTLVCSIIPNSLSFILSGTVSLLPRRYCGVWGSFYHRRRRGFSNDFLWEGSYFSHSPSDSPCLFVLLLSSQCFLFHLCSKPF